MLPASNLVLKNLILMLDVSNVLIEQHVQWIHVLVFTNVDWYLNKQRKLLISSVHKVFQYICM